MSRDFEGDFDYGSILPTIIFVIGLLAIYLFITGQFSEGFLAMLVSFVLYIIDNLIIKNDPNGQSDFNAFLDNMAIFVAFGLTSISFASIFYVGEEDNYLILLPIYFFSITTLLALARNWTLETKNTKGWPIAFNGICLPLMYYVYKFYFQGWESLFLFYFVIIGLLSASSYNFLGFEDNSKRKYKNKTSYVTDEELEGYLKLEGGEKGSQLGIKQAANFYKKKEEKVAIEKPEVTEEYVDDVSEEIVEEFKEEKVEIKKEDLDDEYIDDLDEDIVLDDDKNEEEFVDDEYVDDIGGEVVEEPKKENKKKNDSWGPKPQGEVDHNRKPKHKGFFKSLFSFNVFKKEEAPVLNDKDFPSKDELKMTLSKEEKKDKKTKKNKK